nr:GGDEF domain-containing protein [Lachnospiraceae bacterium]
INKRFISKLVILKNCVNDFSLTKDVNIAGEVDKIGKGHHEISELARQVAAMIREIEAHIEILMAYTKELSSTKEHAARMDDLANKDALTGIRNKTAYDKESAKLDWDIKGGKANFAIAMIDLNFLKRINDTFGHDKGNISIKNLCKIVCTIFEHSPVFRIGGDEFVVILKDKDLSNIDDLIKEFNNKLKELADDPELPPWEKVSAAIGIAYYDPDKDLSAANVFSRADQNMYNNKVAMKATRD